MAIKDNVQGVVLALFGASAGGHLAGLTAAANATSLSTLAGDLASSAGFILGKDLSTAAAFRDNMLTGLGISSTNAAYAAAKAWADGELAKPNANRGEIVASAVSFLAGLTDTTSPYYAVATAYKATVAAAVTWSEGAGATVFGVAALQAQQGTSGGVGSTFALTSAATDLFQGSSGNDTFDASAKNTLSTGDILSDSSTVDTDVLNATVTTNSQAPRLTNIENVNVTGLYLTTGLALTNASGIENLVLNTNLSGGTATVTNANSLNAQNIAAGANISTVSVSSLSSGTRDSVSVDAGNATTVTLTGSATGADTYELTVAADATVTLATVGADDAVTLNIAGDTNLTGVAALEALEINASADADIDVTTALSADTVVNANGHDVTFNGTGATVTGTGITTDGSGVVTFNVTTLGAAEDFKELEIDVLELSDDHAAADTTVKVNTATTVNITDDLTAAKVLTFNVDNADGDFATDTLTGTLLLNVSESQTTKAFTMGATVDTVVISATPDEDSDTEDGAEITIASMTLNAATDVVSVNGSANLTITLLTGASGDETVTARDMTGELTISQVAKDIQIFGGTGNDTFDLGASAISATIYGGAGDDTIDGGDEAGGSDALLAYGEDGADTITGGKSSDTISGGAGNDIIIAKLGANSVTLGEGADEVRLSVDDSVWDGTDDTTITDFVVGTDKLTLLGASTGDVDLSDLTVASGVYTVTTGDYKFKLTGNTATDLTSSIRLGWGDTSAKLFTAADKSTVVAGDLADYIAVATDTSATITTGTGSDVIIATAGAGGDLITVTDFTVGTDKVILSGKAGAAVDLSSVQTDDSFDPDGAGTWEFDLTDVEVTTLKTVVQLGSAGQTFTAFKDTGTVGSDFGDYITTGASTTAAGTSAVTGGLGADRITISTADELDTINFARGDSTVASYDIISGFLNDATAGDADVLNLPSVNIGSAFGDTDVGSITGVEVTAGVVTKWLGLNSATIETAAQLTDALAWLQANVGGTDTVAFEFAIDLDGDGDTTGTSFTNAENGTFVFQSGTTDTLIKLVGLVDVTALSTSGGATTIQIA